MSTDAHAPKQRTHRGRLAGRSAIVMAVAAVLTVGGIAAANWTINGEGSGSADAAEALDLTVALALPSGVLLYPGAVITGDLTVTNPNAFPVMITAVEFTGDVTVTPAVPQPVAGTCGASDHDVTFTDRASLTLVVPADSTDHVLEGALVDAIAMGADAANACQGATFDRDLVVVAAISTD